jgi:hypothetical protein
LRRRSIHYINATDDIPSSSAACEMDRAVLSATRRSVAFSISGRLPAA